MGSAMTSSAATGRQRRLAPGLPDVLPLLLAGLACVIAGGLLAAATAYVSTQKTAWATAYLVLVGGVAQLGLGAAIAWLAPAARRRRAWPAFVGWNLGNAGVLAGQLGGLVVLTDAGSALLVIALVLVLTSTLRSAPARPSAEHGPDARSIAQRYPLLLWAFRTLLVILAAGIAVGTALAHVA